MRTSVRVVLTTDQKGSIAETAVAAAAVKLGFDVYWPITNGGRYDLIIDVHGQLLRVQCKWAVKQGDVVIVRAYSSRRTRDGITRRSYVSGEIDALAAHCAELDRCYILPAELATGRHQIQLRLSPCKNNQQLGVNWAKDFDFRSINWDDLQAPGAIAQLGERSAGSRKGAGSSPASSTPSKPTLGSVSSLQGDVAAGTMPM
jgi:PD-(D/E)XK endonuclease